MKNTGRVAFNVLLTLLLFKSGLCLAAPNQGVDINITAAVVGSPPCTLPSSMSVNFNHVNADKIQDMNVREKIDYAITCTANAKFSLKIIGNNADFDQKVLKTDSDNLGIKFYADNKAWDIKTSYPINYQSPPLLEAVLVKNNNAALSSGNFTGTATLIVEQN